MKKIYLLRHCQTVDNEKNINGSQNDSSLSENGLLMAKDLVLKLGNYKFDTVVRSPLQRTYQTIEPYLSSLKENLPIYIEPLTIERDLGELTGTISGDGSVKASMDASEKSQTEWVPPNGESTVMVGERAKLFLDKIKKMPYKNILICGHQNFLRCLELLINKQEIKIESLVKIEYNNSKLENGEIREYYI